MTKPGTSKITKAVTAVKAVKSAVRRTVKKPGLLSGGNPQIARADGDAPVQAYMAALQGWQQALATRLDELVMSTVPNASKAIRWNSPFYGVEGHGWFMGLHVFRSYIKVTFFRGTSLSPAPPGGTGQDARWLNIREGELDEAHMVDWLRQAAALPGWGKN